jgi:Protein of unknown function (DUF2934)
MSDRRTETPPRPTPLVNPASNGRGSGAHESAGRAVATAVTPELIAQRAYEKFLARGEAHGLHEQDWSEAESELLDAQAAKRS